MERSEPSRGRVLPALASGFTPGRSVLRWCWATLRQDGLPQPAADRPPPHSRAVHTTGSEKVGLLSFVGARLRYSAKVLNEWRLANKKRPLGLSDQVREGLRTTPPRNCSTARYVSDMAIPPKC